MNEELLTVLLKASPIVVLWSAITVIAKGLKGIKRVPNEFIPLFAVLFGAVVYPFIGAAWPLPGIEKLEHAWILYMLVGIGVGGFSVGIHAGLKQIKAWSSGGDTLPTPTPPTDVPK